MYYFFKDLTFKLINDDFKSLRKCASKNDPKSNLNNKFFDIGVYLYPTVLIFMAPLFHRYM